MTPKRGYNIDRSGRKFGLWTVLSFHGTSKRDSVWMCKCECGTTRPVACSNLTSGGSKSCGCAAANGMQPLRKGWVTDGVGYIPLTREQVMTVDALKVEELQQWHWAAERTKNGKFYAYRQMRLESGGQYRLYAARYLLGLGRDDRRQGDHINLDTLDNRISNLRIATQRQNLYNRRVRSDSKTGIKGVMLNESSGKYTGRIIHNGIHINLGTVNEAAEAQKLYAEAATKLQGEFARVE